MLNSKRTAEIAFSDVLVLLLCVIANHEVMSQKIVIVGAGLSGISAAAKLMENGYNDIVILEAEDRIGGRIQSIAFDNGYIDLGAQWCHGQGRNVIYELVNKYFTFGDTGFDKTDELYYLSTGKPAVQKKCVKLASLANKIMENSFAEMEKFNGSLGDFFTLKYKEGLKTTAYNTIPAELTNQMLDYSHKETLTDFASPTWFDISAKLNAQSGGTTKNQYSTWKTQGFKTVFDFITKKLPIAFNALPVESKVQLNKEVTSIRYYTASTTEKTLVSCSDGTSYAADHVIFTASLGVLKARHATLFTPKLPDIKIKAIENIGFGTLGKIFLEFEKPFWPSNVNEFVAYAFLWTDDALKKVKLTDKAWLIDLNTFIRVDGFPNLLEGLIAGRRIAEFEALNDTKLINDSMWLLEGFLGKTLPRPKSMKRTRWLNSKNFLGSYSYLSMATEFNRVSPKLLAESVNNIAGKPVILFAGEATDYDFSSYAHGAVSSGWRVGNELIAYLKKT